MQSILRAQIRKAHPEEADKINQLGIRSKAHRGYTPYKMQVFEQELKIQPNESLNFHSIYASTEGKYSIIPSNPSSLPLR